MSQNYDPCFETAQAAACAKANGWPPGITTREGTDSPEGVETGFWKGDFYVRTTTNKLYVFLGTPGENTGWEEVTSSP